MMVWRVLVVKSVRIPPYRISATALNKAEEDAGERFYALQLFTLGSCVWEPAIHPLPILRGSHL